MKNQRKALNENSVRVIKISKTALFELSMKNLQRIKIIILTLIHWMLRVHLTSILNAVNLFFAPTSQKTAKEKQLNFRKKLICNGLWQLYLTLHHLCSLMVGIRNIQKKNLCRCQGHKIGIWGYQKCHITICKNFWMNIIGTMDLKPQKRF